MRLTVLSIAYSFAPVGPDCVGGAEQILTDLDYALVAAGYSSLVLACESSAAAGELIPFPPLRNSLDSPGERQWCRAQLQAVLDRTLSQQQVDLIHMHGFDFHEYQLPLDIPVLVTLHLPLGWYPSTIWNSAPANLHFQFVSETQRLSCPAVLSDAPVIPNGVEISEAAKKGDDFAMVLGRICPEKNQHTALEAGFLASTPVVMGGHVFPWREHKRYFQEKVVPLLEQRRNGIQHMFCGPLSRAKSRQLLALAKCLLHPTLAPETSSLVAMEAMAAGTPVIAYRSGALPEIVDDGVSGFLVNSAAEMAAAIHRVHTIHREACRATAAQRFSKQRMVEQYFQLYQKMIHAPTHQRLYA
jgi:glycosyltransferase involved in cell wall biosynthesis